MAAASDRGRPGGGTPGLLRLVEDTADEGRGKARWAGLTGRRRSSMAFPGWRPTRLGASGFVPPVSPPNEGGGSGKPARFREPTRISGGGKTRLHARVSEEGRPRSPCSLPGRLSRGSLAKNRSRRAGSSTPPDAVRQIIASSIADLAGQAEATTAKGGNGPALRFTDWNQRRKLHWVRARIEGIANLALRLEFSPKKNCCGRNSKCRETRRPSRPDIQAPRGEQNASARRHVPYNSVEVSPRAPRAPDHDHLTPASPAHNEESAPPAGAACNRATGARRAPDELDPTVRPPPRGHSPRRLRASVVRGQVQTAE